MNKKAITGLILGMLALICCIFLPIPGLTLPGQIALGIFVMAAIFWITEPIPIFSTSMLVILLQVFLLSDKSIIYRIFAGNPRLGDVPGQPYTDFYNTLANPIIILFLGGFSLAAAAVKFDLDKNLTRVLLKPFGKKPAFVLLGLMTVTATLSAFMSNTATTAMMITVVLPIIAMLDGDDPFRKAVALSIPVGANIGGIATPIGTPPNAIALAALAKQGVNIAFSTWMMMAVPLVILMLVFAWWMLLKFFPPKVKELSLNLKGKFNTSSLAVASYIVFAVTVLFWVTENLHGVKSTMIAFLPVALLPALGVLKKQDIRSFSWEVLWLVAGGISLGISMKNTGMIDWIVNLIDWSSLGGVGIIIVFGLVGYGIANLISHTVSATILMPLAVGLGVASGAGADFNLAVGVITIGVIVSFSMILPISTPPNAIAMSTNMIETRDLAKIGIAVGVAGFIFTLISGLFFWPMIIG